MTTKHWKLLVRKDGQPVTLFAATTDAMVEMDLNGLDADSLIRTARQYHRHGQDQYQNHRDLAIGALMAYAAEPAFDRLGAHIEQVPAPPPGEPVHYLVSGHNRLLVPIWEEAEETFEE